VTTVCIDEGLRDRIRATDFRTSVALVTGAVPSLNLASLTGMKNVWSSANLKNELTRA
jgi:hypothetical protein